MFGFGLFMAHPVNVFMIHSDENANATQSSRRLRRHYLFEAILLSRKWSVCAGEWSGPCERANGSPRSVLWHQLGAALPSKVSATSRAAMRLRRGAN